MKYSTLPGKRRKALLRIKEGRKRDAEAPKWTQHVCFHLRAFKDQMTGGYQCADCGAVLEGFDPIVGPTAEDWQGGRSLHAVREKYRLMSVDKPEKGT